MTVGNEWLVDAHGCRPDLLRDAAALRRLSERILRELGLKVVGTPAWHQFPWPGGVTGIYLLTESHLACHTYPESGLATFNLYCCRARPAWPWTERLSEALAAERVSVRCLPRGEEIGAPPPVTAKLSHV